MHWVADVKMLGLGTTGVEPWIPNLRLQGEQLHREAVEKVTEQL
jgi:hypothetical protein